MLYHTLVFFRVHILHYPPLDIGEHVVDHCGFNVQTYDHCWKSLISVFQYCTKLKQGTPKMQTQGSCYLSFLVCIFAVPYFNKWLNPPNLTFFPIFPKTHLMSKCLKTVILPLKPPKGLTVDILLRNCSFEALRVVFGEK